MRKLAPALASLLRRLGGRHAVVEGIATRLDRRALRRRPPSNPTGDEAEELREIVRYRAVRRVRVREPFVLISQVHRSGGTLVQRLLDSHPQLHVIPHELGPLLPASAVPLDRDRAWRLLYDPKLPGRFRRGLRQQEHELNHDSSKTGFLLPPVVHRQLFDWFVDRGGPKTEREFLDTYLTGYFNGWLDYRGLRDIGKRWVVGFEPLLIDQPRRLETFWRVYPDGRLITILRDPASWLVSARRWAPRFEQLDVALPIWRGAALAAEAQLRDGRVLGVLFDELVEDPTAAMSRVADFLGIEVRDELFVPTLNGVPFGANSSFESAAPGTVNPEPARRAAQLTDEERATVDREAGEIYDRVRARIAA